MKRFTTALVLFALTFTATAQIRTDVPGPDTLIIELIEVRAIPCGNCPVIKGVLPMTAKELENYHRARRYWRSKNEGKLKLQKDGTYN